jgi:WD40 repeat protein
MPTIASFDSGSFTEWAGFLGEIPVFADAQGYVRIGEGSQQRLEVHEGLLCATASQDGASLITGGEDGRICATTANGSYEIVHQASTKWIDKIATGPHGAIAFGSGRQGGVILGNGNFRDIEVERSIEGLAFAPKGMRLAIARFDGVELRWINTDGAAQFLEWKGAHTAVMFSKDGKYVVSTMQENALHGWRLTDAKHMRMTGYPAKVASTSFSHRGKWLATSGAPAAIVWPFSGKDGPMDKSPRELGSMGNTLVTRVACHPSADLLAIGYENGMITAARLEDGEIISLRREGRAAISSFGWDKPGGRLAFGSEEGEAGIVDFSGE